MEHRIATCRDDRRSANYREPRDTKPETDRRNVHEGYSDITRNVKVDVPSLDGKIDVTTFLIGWLLWRIPLIGMECPILSELDFLK